jgi:hypothetical protein
VLNGRNGLVRLPANARNREFGRRQRPTAGTNGAPAEVATAGWTSRRRHRQSHKSGEDALLVTQIHRFSCGIRVYH